MYSSATTMAIALNLPLLGPVAQRHVGAGASRCKFLKSRHVERHVVEPLSHCGIVDATIIGAVPRTFYIETANQTIDPRARQQDQKCPPGISLSFDACAAAGASLGFRPRGELAKDGRWKWQWSVSRAKKRPLMISVHGTVYQVGTNVNRHAVLLTEPPHPSRQCREPRPASTAASARLGSIRTPSY